MPSCRLCQILDVVHTLDADYKRPKIADAEIRGGQSLTILREEGRGYLIVKSTLTSFGKNALPKYSIQVRWASPFENRLSQVQRSCFGDSLTVSSEPCGEIREASAQARR